MWGGRNIQLLWHNSPPTCSTYLLCLLGVYIGLILQPLDLRRRCRIGNEARFSSFPRQVRFEQFVSMPDALYGLSFQVLITFSPAEMRWREGDNNNRRNYVAKYDCSLVVICRFPLSSGDAAKGCILYRSPVYFPRDKHHHTVVLQGKTTEPRYVGVNSSNILKY